MDEAGLMLSWALQRMTRGAPSNERMKAILNHLTAAVVRRKGGSHALGQVSVRQRSECHGSASQSSVDKEVSRFCDLT